MFSFSLFSLSNTTTDSAIVITALIATAAAVGILVLQSIRRRGGGGGGGHDRNKGVIADAPLPELKHGDGKFTLAELRQFDGNGKPANWPIYVAINGTVFDVSAKRDAYGPGGSYAVFAGRDASRGLAMSSLKEEDLLGDHLSDLTDKQRQTLKQWEEFFQARYTVAGEIVQQEG